MYSLIRSEMYNDAVYSTYNGPDITRVYPVYGICHYTCIVFATVCVYVCICVCQQAWNLLPSWIFKFNFYVYLRIVILKHTETKNWGGGGTHKPLGLPCGRDDCFHSSCCLVGWTLIKVIIKTTVGVYRLNQEIKRKYFPRTIHNSYSWTIF